MSFGTKNPKEGVTLQVAAKIQKKGKQNVYFQISVQHLCYTCYVKDFVHEPQVELWNVDTQFGRAGKFVNQ